MMNVFFLSSYSTTGFKIDVFCDPEKVSLFLTKLLNCFQLQLLQFSISINELSNTLETKCW